jgi:hypothetical protein
MLIYPLPSTKKTNTRPSIPSNLGNSTILAFKIWEFRFLFYGKSGVIGK